MKILKIRRIAIGAIGLALVLMQVGPAFAAGDEDVRKGVSMVSEIDVARGRMTVDDVEYRVKESTRIERYDGTAATLADIRVPEPRRNELLRTTEWDYIRFVANRRLDRWYMESMVILEKPVQ